MARRVDSWGQRKIVTIRCTRGGDDVLASGRITRAAGVIGAVSGRIAEEIVSTEQSPDSGLTYEELAKTAQRLLAERPVVVLGTGATIPHGLPSMTALADGLLTAITDHPAGWDAFAERLDETKDLEQALHDVPLPQDTVEVLVRAT